jgi:hypothetical protein
MSNNKKNPKYSEEWSEEIKKTITDNNELKTLTDSLVNIQNKTQEKQELAQKILAKEKELKILTDNFRDYVSWQEKILAWEMNRQEYSAKWEAFKNTWQTHGWDNLVKNHYPATYTDNLYQVKLSSNLTTQITEEEVVKLVAKMTLVLAELEVADFNAKYQGTDKNALIKALKALKTQAQAIKKMGKNKEVLDLPQTYSDSNGQAYTTEEFPWAGLFALTRELSDNAQTALVNSLKQDKIPQTADWTFVRFSADYTPEELADYGIILTDSGKTTLYKTGGIKHQEKVTGGLKGWLNLFAQVLANDDNRQKILASYTNSPTSLLFTDLRSGALASDNSQPTTANYRLPEDIAASKSLLSVLNAQNQSDGQEMQTKQQELDNLKKQLSETDQAVINSYNAIETVTQKEITRKREKLKAFNIYNTSQGFFFRGENLKTESELYQIQEDIQRIAYLECGDSSQNTSNAQETKAQQEITNIFTQIGNLRNIHAFHTDNFGLTNPTNQQKCAKIKADYEFSGGLTVFRDEFVELKKWVKPSSRDEQALADIQAALGDTSQINKDWRNKLKAFDPLLEIALTDSILTKWREPKDGQEVFTTLTDVENLWQEAGQLETKPDGTEEITYTDFFTKTQALTNLTGVDNWSKLIVKEPTEVIGAIERYKHEQQLTNLSESEQIQWERKIKKVAGKTQASDSISDAEINHVLYQVAIGLANYETQELDENLQVVTPQPQKDNSPPQKGHFAKYWPYYVGGAVVLILIGMLVRWVNKSEVPEGEVEL